MSVSVTSRQMIAMLKPSTTRDLSAVEKKLANNERALNAFCDLVDIEMQDALTRIRRMWAERFFETTPKRPKRRSKRAYARRPRRVR